MGDFMFDKLSEIKEKSEYQKILNDYSNNYGYNLGNNTFISKRSKDKSDILANKELSVKKR